MTVALLALATGFCLFDQDEDGAAGHVAPPDLCLVMLAVSLVVILLVGLPAVGSAARVPFAAAYAVALHIPHPPPRPGSLL